MSPTWIFSTRRGTDKQRDPAWAEFFHSAPSIRSNCEALIRESIQNSLDQAQFEEGPLRMRFAISGEGAGLDSRRAAAYFDSLWPHLESLEVANKLPGPLPDRSGRCQYLVIEDFNTLGLIGDPETGKEPEGSEVNDFFFFLRAEGKSGKVGAQRGRWGIGKYVFPMSSQIYTFFALTVRDPEQDAGYDQGAGLLMGEAVLLHHDIGDQGYMPDGWWGDARPNEAPIAPTTNIQLLSDFREDWSISRTDEPGLSVVVPYLGDNWSANEIALNIIRDYFSAIVEGRLVVSVDDLSNGESVEIDEASIDDLLTQLPIDPIADDRLSKDIEIVRWVKGQTATPLTLEWTGAPKWASIAHDDKEMDALREQFQEEGRVFVKVPVKVRKTDGSLDALAHLEMILVDDPAVREMPLFVRSGIKVSQAGRENLNTIRGIVLIREQVLTQMVGDAENPAHVDWSHQTKSFKDRYEYGSSWLTFIRNAPKEVVKRMRGSDSEKDYAVTAAYFSVPGSGRQGDSGGGDNSGGGSGGGKGGTKKPKRGGGGGGGSKTLVKIEKIQGGFRIELTDAGKKAKVAEISGKVAYDVRSGNPFKRWTSDDFGLGGSGAGVNIAISCIGGVITHVRNEFHIDIDNPSTFKFEATGFDTNRDLKVVADAVT